MCLFKGHRESVREYKEDGKDVVETYCLTCGRVTSREERKDHVKD